MEKIDFYLWRIKILLCYFGHDFENVYTRVSLGGDKDGQFSGRMDCRRCYHSEYFSGRQK